MISSSVLPVALNEARECMDSIFAHVHPDSFYERGIPERHRLIFYLGHVEAFDWNQVCRWTLGKPSFHETFDQLFEAGIDPKVGTLSQDQPSDWPTLDEVFEYNRRVREEIDQAMEYAPPDIVSIAIEHRWMHVETTAYILHRLPNTSKVIPACSPLRKYPSPIHDMIEVPAGVATLGEEPSTTFGWDNEFNRHEVPVPAFSMSKYKVTNGQYLRFVQEGAAPPSFWVQRGNTWFLRTMFGEQELPLDWPVYVSQREAQAYAAWAGLALPTEAQFHRAAYGTRIGEERLYPWGDDTPDKKYGNFGFHRWDPEPVTAHPEGESDFGFAQLVGNGWEWTSTPFHPFEGFMPHSTYPGYSARFFDDDHYVVKGAGPQTAPCLLRRSFRNWFRPGYPYADIGFRCVQN
ncbi:MAG: SUMF1/EgtB/PvdO family nonheme iron enzyme [Nitrospirales bacterium]|nr:SUMF1/EgtB/PvdO family nonheme iron enzyme [Nitrospira sp.]MDR4501540.1 SUMF1/EgtB/PvdO family nonheme iron enzyme [Nitrospirales bacterium]